MAGEERARVEECRRNAAWRRWGPYLTERQWGTVREDYSPYGTAWDYFPHDMARSRAYRWGEDGIGGFSDKHGLLCMAPAFWNGKDPILKERLFGLTNSQGNHGEDVKECYWYIDGVPSHAYMRMRYRYPQAAFPYEELVRRNAEATRLEPEFELEDTGVFEHNRFFDIEIEYAKRAPSQLLSRITAVNRGPDAATLWVLPTFWFRNRWTWDHTMHKPVATQLSSGKILLPHPRYGEMYGLFDDPDDVLFTENITNAERVFGSASEGPYQKDAFHRYVIENDFGAVNPAHTGSKVGGLYRFEIEAGGSRVVRTALLDEVEGFPKDFDATFKARIREADDFYKAKASGIPDEIASVQRQAFAGLLWSKQFYHLDIDLWLKGDPDQPKPPRTRTRDKDWKQLHAAEVLSMPDTWEYPWFAAWDLAFHMVPLSLIDPTFAKEQLVLLLREWYMHPNGQIPAYEWAFSDVNPPVHAWSAWRIYNIERRMTGKGDLEFLKRVFHKLLLNFTWWVNREDALGNNVFEGGFLGLDNIGVFDRNEHLEDGSFIEQSDGTAWMAMFCLNMLDIGLELAVHDEAYQDVASKFFEHFLYIAEAMNVRGIDGLEMWDPQDEFYYDVLRHANGSSEPLKVRSAVGFIPLFAATTIEPDLLEKVPDFAERMQWFLDHRPEMAANVPSMVVPGQGERLLLSIVPPERIKPILRRVLDESEFLSDHGLRALSKFHRDHPYKLMAGGKLREIDYEPGESTTGAFGGNSNWRGPVWFPINFLMIEALQRFDYYFGENFKVEMPEGSGVLMRLGEVAASLEHQLLQLFLVGSDGIRPCDLKADGPLIFNEYFHGDTGKGLGAAHQTGWTAVIAKIIEQLYITAPGASPARKKRRAASRVS